MAQVEVLASRILVKDLSLDDQEAAHILGEYKQEEYAEVVRQALRLGLILRRQVSTVVNVDFVKLEFKNLQQAFERYWREDVVAKIDSMIANYFDSNKGSLPRQLAQYFGDAQDQGKLAALFDEKNTSSVTFKLRQMIKDELTGEGSTFLKALNPDDDNTPMGKLKNRVIVPIGQLEDKVIGKKAAQEIAEAGTQNGGPYKDLVFNYIDKIAASFGDKAEDVSNQNVAGDYVVTLDSETVPGQSIRIAIDSKDKTMGLKASEETLRESKDKWSAQAAMLVFAREDQTPFARPVGLRKLGEGYVCVFDKEDLDQRVLQAAYQITRLDAVRSIQRSAVLTDPAVVQEKLEQAIQKLQEFVTIKRKLTVSINELNSIRTFVDGLHGEFRDRLEETWQALGVKAPIPIRVDES